MHRTLLSLRMQSPVDRIPGRSSQVTLGCPRWIDGLTESSASEPPVRAASTTPMEWPPRVGNTASSRASAYR